MTDVATRPMTSVQTELRRSVHADDSEIAVISTTGFTIDADKQIGAEFVRCTEFGSDAFGWPVMRGCQRGVAREDGGSEPRPWPGGTPVYEVGWTAVDILTEIPEPTPSMVGRQFNYRDPDGAVYTFNVVTLPDGITPIIDWINEPPSDEDAPQLALASAIVGLSNLTGVAVDASGNLYVYFNSVLRKYSPALATLWSDTTVGSGHVATDGTSVFATHPNGDLVYKKLASTGADGSPATFGSAGLGDGEFDGPSGIATNGTHVWVVDAGNNRVQKFTVAGAYVSQFGALGSGDGQFNRPTGIALDDAGNMYVADEGNSRIQIFSPAHAHLLSFGDGGNADGKFNIPDGIAVDSDDNIWVTDRGNHRIQVFDSAGVFLAKIGNFGSSGNQLKSPRQIAFDTDDFGYVADFDNDRLSSVRIVPPGVTPAITVRSNSGAVNAGVSGTVTASCLAGEVAISGGGSYGTPTANAPCTVDRPDPTSGTPTGWEWGISNGSGANKTVTTYAVCLQTPLVES